MANPLSYFDMVFLNRYSNGVESFKLLLTFSFDLFPLAMNADADGRNTW